MAKIKITTLSETAAMPTASDEATDPGDTGKKKVMVSVKPTSAISNPDEETIDLQDSGNLKSGKFFKKHIKGLAAAAKAVGVNPYQLLALGWQESNLGGSAREAQERKIKEAKLSGIKTQDGRSWRDRSKSNIGQVNGIDNPEELSALAQKTGLSTDYLAPALALRDKLKYAKHLGFTAEDMQLQAYNGYGKIPAQKDPTTGKVIPTKYYGLQVPDSGIDMRKTPLYGRRLMALKSDLMKSKDINDIINGG